MKNHEDITEETKIHHPKGFTELSDDGTQRCPVRNDGGGYTWQDTSTFSGIQGPAGPPAPIITVVDINDPTAELAGKSPTSPGFAETIILKEIISSAPDRFSSYVFDTNPGPDNSPLVVPGDSGSWVNGTPHFLDTYENLPSPSDFHGFRIHTHQASLGSPLGPNESGISWQAHSGQWHDFSTSNTDHYKRSTRNSRTGVIKPSVAIINSGDNTKVDIPPMTLQFIDAFTDQDDPKKPQIISVNRDAVSPDFLGVSQVTFLGIDSLDTLIQQATPFTRLQKRTIAYFAAVLHEGSIVDAVVNVAQVVSDPMSAVSDLIGAIGLVNEAAQVQPEPGTTGLRLSVSSGNFISDGANRSNSEASPNDIVFAGLVDATMNYSFRDGVGGYTTTTGNTVITNLWDDGTGTLAVVPTNKFVSHRPRLSPINGLLIIEVGQKLYDSFLDASLSANSETDFGSNPLLASIPALGRIIMKSGISGWTNPNIEFIYLGGSDIGMQVVGTTQGTFPEAFAATRTPLPGTEVDFADGEIRTKTLTANTTLTIINPKLFKTIILEIDSDASETLTLPGSVVVVDGAYSVSGATNYIEIQCVDESTPVYIATFKRDGGVNTPTKDKFFSVGADTANQDNYSVRTAGSTTSTYFSFNVPHDFNSLVSLEAVGYPIATFTNQNIDLLSNYCAIGEDRTTNAESDVSNVVSATINIMTAFDISGVFSSLAAENYAGIQLNHAGIGTTFKYLGIRMRYN